MAVRVVEHRWVEILFYAVWALLTLFLLVYGSLLIRATWVDLESKLDTCVVRSSQRLVDAIENTTSAVSEFVNPDNIEQWLVELADGVIDEKLGDKPLRASAAKLVVNRKIDQGIDLIRNEVDIGDSKMFDFVSTTVELIDQQILVVMETIIEVISYIAIVQLVALVTGALATVLHIYMIAVSRTYRLAVHGAGLIRTPNRRLSVSVLLRYVILLTTTVTGSVAALMFVLERYALTQIPVIKPIITCSIVSNLEEYGLPAAILAAAIDVVMFLEPIGINGVTLSSQVYGPVDRPNVDGSL